MTDTYSGPFMPRGNQPSAFQRAMVEGEWSEMDTHLEFVLRTRAHVLGARARASIGYVRSLLAHADTHGSARSRALFHVAALAGQDVAMRKRGKPPIIPADTRELEHIAFLAMRLYLHEYPENGEPVQWEMYGEDDSRGMCPRCTIT